MPPKGQHDFSGLRITRHAIERMVERFTVPEAEAEGRLRELLSRTRRLGRNPENEAIALLAVSGDKPIVAIVQGEACLTVLTWAQFEPRLAEFGRDHVPRKWGRFLRRLKD